MKFKRTGRLVVAAMLAAGSVSAQAALHGRDLNGDATVDAFYDTDLDITWLRNADVNGLMNWETAVSWAAGFNFGGYDAWRLPTATSCSTHSCDYNEMAHLYYDELGNVGMIAIQNRGGFLNLQNERYWSGAAFALDPNEAWLFNNSGGFQGTVPKTIASYAMAVHPGDIGAAVPEPATVALMLTGLAAVGAIARCRNA